MISNSLACAGDINYAALDVVSLNFTEYANGIVTNRDTGVVENTEFDGKSAVQVTPNPNYTEDAVKYLAGYSSAVAKQKKKLKTGDQKKAFRDSWDWDRMTAQDESVWEEIFKTLDA